jgi:hypothetical protein
MRRGADIDRSFLSHWRRRNWDRIGSAEAVPNAKGWRFNREMTPTLGVRLLPLGLAQPGLY